MMKNKVGIVGITGRMGTLLEELLRDSADFSLAGGISSKSTKADFEKVIGNSDVLIDFSSSFATMAALEVASRCGTPSVIGTTALSPEDFEKIKVYSQSIPIMYCTNFSLGIQLMATLLQKCAAVLPEFDFSIIDVHHKKKKDSPSGTALFLAEQVGKEAQIVGIRSGNVCGDHICDFCGDDEMLSISHRVFNRAAFAKGALKCASWLLNQKPALYSTKDYLDKKMHAWDQ
ncbi:4-hydroxy-tetrahydrodipicolinate reductase [Alphaproteobacteria bacterium]|nr:4-hydroxy-tetrahydrodipicolinate reductase [Alphaproteobacteria bacterium]